METIIAVFNNRSHTMQFASYLKRIGVRCKTINTPRELSVACGLSAVFPANALKQAEFIVDRYKFSSFVKFYYLISNRVFKKYIPM